MNKIPFPLWASVFFCLSPLAFGQAPANDDFANAQIISGITGSANGSNVEATIETNEPTFGSEDEQSVWFQWTAPESGLFTFNLTADFDSQLEIRPGTLLDGNLSNTGESSVSLGIGPESVTFYANAGSVFQVRVTGVPPASGSFSLNWGGSLHPVFERLFSFTDTHLQGAAKPAVKGIHPVSGLIQGADGDFYGTTEFGGEFGELGGSGTIYKMTPSGAVTTLVEFTNDGATNRGGRPKAALVQGSDGNYYGTTTFGGTNYFGTVFKMTPAGVLTTLVDFSGNGTENKGNYPYAALIQGSDGDFYGTTREGGSNGSGTIFKMTSAGVLTTLVDFTGNGPTNKGANPEAALVEGDDGNFYGTTNSGGANFSGTVFKMSPAGVLTTLVEFTGNGTFNRGSHPTAALIQGTDGDFYGTTTNGGFDEEPLGFGNGTVFKMTPAGVLTTLVEFTGDGATNRGSTPFSALVQGTDGDFYGTTESTGPTGAGGTVFKMTSAGLLTTLAEFSSDHAGLTTLVQGSNGNFYGTTAGSSMSEVTFRYLGSTIYTMTPSGDLTSLVEFTELTTRSLGRRPAEGLIQGSDGDFYGTTLAGGVNDLGTVFKATAAGNLTTLVEFTGVGPENKGATPFSGLVEGTDGNFYGTTSVGGEDIEVFVAAFGDTVVGYGTIFKVTPAGVLTTLVEFSGNGASNKGSYPTAALVQGSDGNFYGTTKYGGADDLGTVFKMTPAGVLTTLVEFTGITGANKGTYPSASLIQATDGNFYGSTERGGEFEIGTIFKMTPAGELTTLVEFGNTIEGANPQAALIQGSNGDFYGSTTYGGNTVGTLFKITPAGDLTTLVVFSGEDGRNPFAALVEGDDGDFYGTTASGGVAGTGTLFRMTPDGLFTNLVEFTDDSFPMGTLLRGTDGALYGTTQGFEPVFGTGDDGSIFRMVFRGVPNVSLVDAKVQGTGTAVIQAKVNPAGAATTVTLEYGTDGISFPNQLVVQPNFTGFQSILVGRTLEGLIAGTNYFYRFRAVNLSGETVSPIGNFSTFGVPFVAATNATDIGPTSVRLHGTVNARNYGTTARFEWGTDGNTFPNQAPVEQGLITGSDTVPVTAAVAGLSQGVTYFYRVVATNIGGTGISGSQSFRTIAVPTATLGEPTAITSQSATLNGTVNAEGSPASVIFEYGTDGITFPNSIGATPSTVTGDQTTAVTANLSGLTQGETYYYRIRATSAGGIGVSDTGPLALDILSGFVQIFPNAPPEAQGFVFVTLLPSGIGSWRFEGEQLWRSSGIPVGGLATGDRVIEFRPIPGYLQPPPETVGVVSGGAATFLERVYYQTPVSGTGGITVTLKPEALALPSVPEAERAQWRLLGEDDTQWRDSDTTLGDLAPGNYLVECKPVAGRNTPPPSTVAVADALTTTPTITYFLADPTTGTLPSLIPFESVSTDETRPYAYVGQIRSNVGASTGFVVKPRVVATAGHVVFDDGTLSTVIGLQWLFQRHAGTNEPKPQIPRGFYNYDGYAAQRAIENTPGSSTPASQNLDVASIYFLEDAGRGGFAGFLASDALDNEFLLSSANKMLVGYPIAGITPLNQGKMHATPPANVTFTRAFDKTYTTSAIRSSGGASGGPICVQFENGNYYPAAIYLGGTGQTVVRSIDSQVIELFNRADVSANGGDNNTDGGITHTSVAGNLNTTQAGAIRVIIEPAEAREGGAAWKLDPETRFRLSSAQKSGLTAGTYNLNLNTVPGFFVPPVSPVIVYGGQVTTITFTYLEIETLTPLETWRQTHFETTENIGDAADNFDFDKDGETNIEEFTAGTDPKNIADVFKMTTTTKVGNTFTTTSPGKAGRTYTLLRNSALTGTWTRLGSQGPLANDATVTLEDPTAPPDKSFYIIEVTFP